VTNLVLGGQPFEVAAARQRGISRRCLRAWLAQGRLRQVLHEVFVDAAVPDSLDVRAACLALRLPPGAALSRGTASWLYGVDPRAPWEREQPLPVECTVPARREPLSRPGVRSYAASLAGDVVDVRGLPCTTPVRTAIDLLRYRPPHMGLAVADAMAHRSLVDPAELSAAVERFGGGRGVAAARRLAGFVEPATESFGESWLRLRLLDAGFPRPVAQIVVPELGYRLDLGWPRRRIAVEYDGEEFHGTPEQRAYDERRRAALERCGWTVVGVGRGEVLGPSLALERGVGQLLGLEPVTRHRLW
jgi:very-short-patch-repair endonuclease